MTIHHRLIFFQICRFCWHRIRTDENELCPACRKAYSENPAEFKPLSEEQVRIVDFFVTGFDFNCSSKFNVFADDRSENGEAPERSKAKTKNYGKPQAFGERTRCSKESGVRCRFTTATGRRRGKQLISIVICVFFSTSLLFSYSGPKKIRIFWQTWENT